MELGEIEDYSIISWLSVSSGTVMEQNEGRVPCIGSLTLSSAIVLVVEREGGKE